MSTASSRAVIESMPFPVFIKGRDGRYLACNQRFVDFVGLPATQIIGHRASDISPPHLAILYEAPDSALWSDGVPQVYDTEARPFDGTVRDVRFHKSLFRDDAGEVVGIIGILLDVTEEKRATGALCESEARFARLAELTREGVVLHADGTILDANPAFCAMTGWSRDELTGQDAAALLGQGDHARVTIQRRDGTLLPAELQWRSTDCGGRDVRVTTVTDITARLQAEQAMAEREMLYRQMFETNVAVKLLIDPANGQIVDANRAAERFYGWSLDVLRRMNITQINTLPIDEVRAEMACAQSENRLFFRFPHRTARGDIRIVEVYSGPVTFLGRQLLHSIIFDVTDRERALVDLERKTDALEQSNADLQQFAYVASHDLQEPLRTVVSYLQLLERRHSDQLDDEAREFMAFAVNGAKRMSQLIQDLLSYSRVDSQGGAFERVDTRKVLDDALANLHFLLQAMNAVVEVGELPPVMGDASQIASVIQNLVGNAVKYRRRDHAPVIRISAAPDDESSYWVFSISDNGIGISPEYHERIFKIFQRLHTQSQYPGTGIGLALVRRIVSRHGGRVWVESNEGGGATFRFTLPRA